MLFLPSRQSESVSLPYLTYTLCGMQHFTSRLGWPSQWKSVSLLLDIEDNTVLLLLILRHSEFYSDNANGVKVLLYKEYL